VIGLRDNLLQAARKERQICLDREEKRRSVELRASRDASTQTDPVSLASERRPSALLSTGMLDMTVSTGSSQLGWSRADEEAQSEAVRTIQLLAQRGSSSRGTEGRVAELEAQLQAERSARQERETQQAHERSRKEAAQQQVLCLEYELDGKEAALQERKQHCRTLSEGSSLWNFAEGNSEQESMKRLRKAEKNVNTKILGGYAYEQGPLSSCFGTVALVREARDAGWSLTLCPVAGCEHRWDGGRVRFASIRGAGHMSPLNRPHAFHSSFIDMTTFNGLRVLKACDGLPAFTLINALTQEKLYQGIGHMASGHHANRKLGIFGTYSLREEGNRGRYRAKGEREVLSWRSGSMGLMLETKGLTEHRLALLVYHCSCFKSEMQLDPDSFQAQIRRHDRSQKSSTLETTLNLNRCLEPRLWLLHPYTGMLSFPDSAACVADCTDAGQMEKAAAEAERLAAARRVLKEDEDKEGPQQAATESRNVNIAVHMQAICNSITCQSSVSRLLPQPKAIQPSEPGPEDGGDEAGDDVDVHFHRAGRPRDKPRADPSALAWVVQSARAPDVDEGLGILPDSLLKHPMMRERPDRADGPSPEELSQMRAEKREFVHIRADAMKDPNWQMSSLLAGQPGISHLSKLSEEASMYDAAQWESTAHANPTKYQKKKHQINWLAHEAMEKEAELLDRGAVQRMTKAQTQARYGW
ncbi:unnamed protein product, partial [Polarella glacialis]